MYVEESAGGRQSGPLNRTPAKAESVSVCRQKAGNPQRRAGLCESQHTGVATGDAALTRDLGAPSQSAMKGAGDTGIEARPFIDTRDHQNKS